VIKHVIMGISEQAIIDLNKIMNTVRKTNVYRHGLTDEEIAVVERQNKTIDL